MLLQYLKLNNTGFDIFSMAINFYAYEIVRPMKYDEITLFH